MTSRVLSLARGNIVAAPVLALAAAVAVLAAAGCGSGARGEDDAGARVRVSAAASLRTAFEAVARTAGLPAPAFSFAGSDVLAAQIRQGARPDVYAAANEVLPAQLHQAGLLERPVVFATNELVIAVPTGRDEVRALDDLGHDGVTIAAGAPSVPVGSYTRAVLGRLPRPERLAIERNIRSAEPDVAGVVGKLTEGAVDAGFAYRSDVRASGGRLRAIALPAAVRPRIAYAAGIVVGAPDRAEAEDFLRALRSPAARRALVAAGFGVPGR